MTTTRQRILDFIEAHPGCTYREIAEAVGIRPEHRVTTVLCQLRDRGLVEGDRRGRGGSAPPIRWRISRPLRERLADMLSCPAEDVEEEVAFLVQHYDRCTCRGA